MNTHQKYWLLPMEATVAAASATNTTQMTERTTSARRNFFRSSMVSAPLAAGQQPPSRASRKVSSSSCAAASSSSVGTRRQRVKYTSRPRMAVSRLPACSQHREEAESATSSVTSSPRVAGRQWRTLQPMAPSAISSRFT